MNYQKVIFKCKLLKNKFLNLFRVKIDLREIFDREAFLFCKTSRSGHSFEFNEHLNTNILSGIKCKRKEQIILFKHDNSIFVLIKKIKKDVESYSKDFLVNGFNLNQIEIIDVISYNNLKKNYIPQFKDNEVITNLTYQLALERKSNFIKCNKNYKLEIIVFKKSKQDLEYNILYKFKNKPLSDYNENLKLKGFEYGKVHITEKVKFIRWYEI